MSNAPRYRLVGYDIGTAPDENGGWVHWTDHEAIVARLTAERDYVEAYAAVDRKVANKTAADAVMWIARAEKAEAERDAALAGAKTLTDVGLKFHSACTSAWACGEPEHKVIAMLDAAEEFCVVLVAFETDIRALLPPADLAAKIGGE